VNVGIVFQAFHLIPTMTALENVAVPLEFAGERDAFARAERELSAVGLAERINHYPVELSGGEQQRVAIARAIVRRPDLLIADEPTGNIDDEIAMLLVRVFERINKLGTTVLIATHDVAFAGQFAHRRYHLDKGELAAASAAEAVVE
jgi:putative ABC transport system ATP-binding protein